MILRIVLALCAAAVAGFLAACAIYATWKLLCWSARWGAAKVRKTLRHGRHQHYQPWRLSWWIRDAAEDTSRWMAAYLRELLRANGIDDPKPHKDDDCDHCDSDRMKTIPDDEEAEFYDYADSDDDVEKWAHDLREDGPPVPPRDAVDDLTEEFALGLNVPGSGQSYGLTPGPRHPDVSRPGQMPDHRPAVTCGDTGPGHPNVPRFRAQAAEKSGSMVNAEHGPGHTAVLYGFSRHLSGDRDWTPRAVPPRVEPGRQPAFTTQQAWQPDHAYLRTDQGTWQLGGWAADHAPVDQPAWGVVRPVREIRAVDDTLIEPPARAPWFGFVEWALTAPIEDIHDYLAVTA